MTGLENLHVVVSLADSDEDMMPTKDHFVRDGATLCHWLEGGVMARVDATPKLTLMSIEEYLSSLDDAYFEPDVEPQDHPLCSRCQDFATVLFGSELQLANEK